MQSFPSQNLLLTCDALKVAISLGSNAYNRQNWEDADFLILCQICLGENPYLQMINEKYRKECKICARPFTVFHCCSEVCMCFKKI